MPQLLAFLPCEKAIVANDGALSAISLIESLSANLPPNVPSFAPNTVAPIKWFVITIFRRMEGDDNKSFTQRTKLILPNGQIVADVATEFIMTHPMVRNINTIDGFPIGVSGECTLRLEVSATGSTAAAKVLAEFPIAISHVPAPAA